ncbi:hypothetical protein [Variovorax paradoxus]|uniref:Uncharacterized protein n=1 Tax=Variovorax paradoxus TaxID=34073 RepID=A0A6I6HN45_VARPD|nr:hypothetical protein [Variovorax paradoxus]QGW84388.1 hypothetical protein GOQ09_23695 [Variovorax paradoxus]
MSDSDLTPTNLKRQHAEAIAKYNTFQTHGVSESAAKSYLKTKEGILFLTRLNEAAPDAPIDKIRDRAVEQLTSGRELPRMEVINEPLVKIVPAGSKPSPFSPFWAKEADLDAAVKTGKNLSDHFALPIGSEAPRYDVYRIAPKAPTEVFISTVAPTTELDGQVRKAGGATQYVTPNRQLFESHTYVKSVDNLHVVQAAREASPALLRQLGAAEAAALGLKATAIGVGVVDSYITGQKVAHLLNQGNTTGAQSEILHFAGRAGGGAAGAVAGSSLGGAVAGPWGAVGGGILGGAAGILGGDKLLDAADQQHIHTQRGSDGNSWYYDERPGQGWMRISADEGPGRAGMPVRAVRANALLADELNYKASSTAVELALAHPRPPQDPFRQAPERIGEAVRPGIGANEPWTRDPQSHAWTRQAIAPATPLTHGMPVQRTVTASPEQSRQLDAAAQRVIAANVAHSPQAIAQRYLEAYGQHGWKQHGPVPAAVTSATSGHVREEPHATPRHTPAQPQPASGHLTPQQIERITTHESRIVPTPGGMSFAEAHRRRDEPEQISPGSLRPVGKLDTSQMDKGSRLYRMHLAQEQAHMRDLEIALTQDRERFKNEPSPQRTLQPSVERMQERVQEQAPAPSKGEHAVAPEAQAHVGPARPPAGAEAMHSPTTQVSTHASIAAPVHSNPQGDAAAIAAAQAQAAAAQAQAIAAQAELAATRQQMARMAAERHDGLERRDERDERDQRDQPGTTQISQGRDSRQDSEAGTHGMQVSATAVADASRPLLREFSDPRHPQNALYNTLIEVLPEGTSPRWVAQATAACYMSNIRKPDDLGDVHGINGTVLFRSTSLPGRYAALEATQPLRTVQQTMQDVQQFDEQRAIDRAQSQAQAAAQANQQQGPVMG